MAVAHEAPRAQTVAKSVDYHAARNVLTALAGRPAPSALMTTIGTTDRKGSHEWKQRGTTLHAGAGGEVLVAAEEEAWVRMTAD